MDNDAKALRCYVLAANVCDLARSGKRDPDRVANIFQGIQDDTHWDDRYTMPVVADTSKIREELILWQKFDQKFFPDVNVGNYTNLRMPNLLPGFNWPIVNARGISTNQLVDRMRKEFKVWTYINSLDTIQSDRFPISLSYTVLIHDQIEANKEVQRKSAITVAEEGILTVTLHEWLRLEFFHWWKTQVHLDVVGCLCTGSRCPKGNVPGVYWQKEDDMLRLDRYPVTYGDEHIINYGDLRPRAVSA